MIKLLSNSQMRAADEYTINRIGIPSRTLMRRAGAAIAEEAVAAVASLGARSVTVVCGTGNNGGDGYVCAEILKSKGLAVNVFAFGGRLSPDCEREKAAYTGSYTDEIQADVIVDCIFGTGLTRAVSGEYAEVIEKINRSSAYVISADIPSGINGDNGRVFGCAVKADLTVAIAELKLGVFLGDGFDYCGAVVRKDIGIILPEENYITVYGDGDIREFYPERRRNTHKGSFGSANVIAGSDRYVGAAALSTAAALKSGCGYVRLTTTEKIKFALAAKYPQAVYLENYDLSSQSVAIGMGCSVSVELYATIKLLLEQYRGTLIIDADGLNTLAKYGAEVLKNKTCTVIITPHVKEFSRLTGKTVEEIFSDPVKYATEFAREYSAVVLLKGAASVITDGRRICVNVRGNTALAKGGSGDMLAGYMCGCAARGLEAFDAAVCAAYTLGLAAEISAEADTEYCVGAQEIVKNINLAVKRLTE